jgi:micrococcal nuclease
MQFLQILTTILVATIASQSPLARPEFVAVRGVVNGSTIDVASYGRIRLAGVKAPRPNHAGLPPEPFAAEARQRLEAMLTHHLVRLEFPSSSSRTSAYVVLDDGTFVNALLAGEGLVLVTVRGRGLRPDALLRAQATAQAERRGIWSALRLPPPP